MKMKTMLAVVAALWALGEAASQAQEKKPLSPPAKAEATVGGKKITINYSAPSMRGRKIMGGLVPLGEVWRTGANAATTMTTEGALVIGNLNVPAGTYTLFTIPGEKEWTLIINKQTGQWGTDYDKGQDLGRVPMKVRKLDKPVETFAIAVVPGKGKDGTLTMTWENTEASVSVAAK
ncbi:MAG TPA: DUF2911 domain-containing protein [Polyangia bacterium]|jgi:hypothetical protein|nr:DUF2911 domain-containing protein [Polyangia bacterium]